MPTHGIPPSGSTPPSGNGWPLFEGTIVDRLFRRSTPPLAEADFSGQTFLVVYNTKARLNPRTGEGEYAREAPFLRQQLESMGARVVFLETHPDPTERAARIRQAAVELFALSAVPDYRLSATPNYRMEGGTIRPEAPAMGPINLLPVGGDGTVGQTLQNVTEIITGPIRLIPPDSHINEEIRRHIESGTALSVGTAGDIGRQLGAPPPLLFGLRNMFRRVTFRAPLSPFADVPDFYRISQTIPMPLPSVHSEVAPDLNAFHSVGFVTSGYLFTQAEANRRNDPNNWMNRGLLGYFRVLPQAVREYGLRGVDVEIEHHGRTNRFRVGEVLGTPNRIVAAVGGVPGRWGEFKLLAIPNGPTGIFVMGESVFRGLLTQLGINMVGTMENSSGTQLLFRMARAATGRFGVRFDFNMVGADSVLWSLSRDRQITLRPGERARLRFFDPETRAPIEVPWTHNGDAVPRPTHEAEIYIPPITVPMRVDQKAVAMRLYQQDELRRGLSLSDGYDPPLPIARAVTPPTFLPYSAGGGWATSAYYPGSDLRALVTGLDMEPSRLPLLVARAHGVSMPADLSRIHENSLSMEAVERWVRSPEGRAQILSDRALLGDTFRNRLETHGVGLGLGLATMFASDHLATAAGIDPQEDRLLHFSAVALMSHGMNQVGNGLASVAINRLRGIPYDWAMVQSRSAEGLLASRMAYEYHPSLLRAFSTSALRSMGVEGGAGSLIRRGARNIFGVPIRMAWGMGLGLASSRLADSLLSYFYPQDSEFRRYASSAAFFAPSIYHLMAGNRGLGILESATMRRINGAFAVGFMADMGYTAYQSWRDGDRAGYERSVTQRASALRDMEEGVPLFSVRRAFDLLCPEIGAYANTRDGFSFNHNNYYDRVLDDDRRRIRRFFGPQGS